MHVGKHQSTARVRPVQDTSALEIGNLVAIYSEDPESEPWIGRLEGITNTMVDVVWLEGSYTKKWKEAKVQDPITRRKKIDWKDTVPKSSIILFDFELTSAGNLRKATIEHLKKAYDERREERTN